MLKPDKLGDFEDRDNMGSSIDGSDVPPRGEIKLLKKPRADRKPSNGGRWTKEEDRMLFEIVQFHGPKCWKKIASLLGPVRTDVQCLHRYNKVLKPGLQKGSWSDAEDDIVREMVQAQGIANVRWSAIAEKLPGRLGKQCRERWLNHLDPSIKKGDWTPSEDRILYEAQVQFGNRWCEVAKILPGRTENAVKNRWHSSTMKRWMKETGLEPGPGTPLVEITPSNAESVLAAFTERLFSVGVVVRSETAAALRSLFHTLHNDDDEEEEEERGGGGGGGGSGGGHDMDIDRDKEVDRSGSSRGMEFDVNMDDAETCWSEYGLPPTPLPVQPVKSSTGMMGIPAHLRPPSIDTTVASDPSRSLMGVARDHDDNTSKRLIEMLHNLKATPSPASTSGRKKRSRREVVVGSPEGVLDKVDFDDRVDVYEGFGTDNESPTSRALTRLREALAAHSASSAVDDDIVPLQMLPYFKFLNDSAQRSLMRQLIDRFQRTSCTPRNSVMLATPRYPTWGSLISPTAAAAAAAAGSTTGAGSEVDYFGGLRSILGSPKHVGAVDPDCFEVHENDDDHSAVFPFPGTSTDGKDSNSSRSDFDRASGAYANSNARVKGKAGKNKTPMSQANSASTSPMSSISPTNADASQTSYYSVYDETAIEAAVMIAYQVASHSTSAEELLQVLTDNPSVTSGGGAGSISGSRIPSGTHATHSSSSSTLTFDLPPL